MYKNIEEFNNSEELKKLFFQKSVDMVLNERKLLVPNNYNGKILKNMIYDSAMFYSDNSDSYFSSKDIDVELKRKLYDKYCVLVLFVDHFLEGKRFPLYCEDSYDKVMYLGKMVYDRRPGNVEDNSQGYYESFRRNNELNASISKCKSLVKLKVIK